MSLATGRVAPFQFSLFSICVLCLSMSLDLMAFDHGMIHFDFISIRSSLPFDKSVRLSYEDSLNTIFLQNELLTILNRYFTWSSFRPIPQQIYENCLQMFQMLSAWKECARLHVNVLLWNLAKHTNKHYVHNIMRWKIVIPETRHKHKTWYIRLNYHQRVNISVGGQQDHEDITRPVVNA